MPNGEIPQAIREALLRHQAELIVHLAGQEATLRLIEDLYEKVGIELPMSVRDSFREKRAATIQKLMFQVEDKNPGISALLQSYIDDVNG